MYIFCRAAVVSQQAQVLGLHTFVACHCPRIAVGAHILAGIKAEASQPAGPAHDIDAMVGTVGWAASSMITSRYRSANSCNAVTFMARPYRPTPRAGATAVFQRPKLLTSRPRLPQ